jgi:hypothetical protein
VTDEAAVVAAQVGRPLRSQVTVLGRCHLGLPVVAAVPPLLDDGTPFPTRYWLSCPLAVRRIGRLEAGGGVRQADRRAAEDPGFGERLAAAHARYSAERDALVPEAAPHRPSGGVGGSSSVKCLHAHYADHAAGNANPVGEVTAVDVEPLNCPIPCVVEAPNGAVRNPEWVEPAIG